MDAVRGLLIFLLVGLSTPAHGLLREFHFVNQLKTWTEAQSYCREKLFDLVTMESADDWARVRELVGNSAHTEAWMGLYNDMSSWRWSLDNSSLTDQQIGTWFAFTPATATENCVKIYSGKLYDRPCDLITGAVCYDEASDSYVPLSSDGNWETTQSNCRQSHTGLASIRNQQEFDAVNSVMIAGGHYWIGLYKQGQGDVDNWKWSDWSESSFREWGPAEPGLNPPACGAAAVDGWKVAQCSEQRPFICSAPQMKVLKVTLKTDGSVNLNQPLEKEAVLKQMEKDLGEQGVHQEFRLRWRKRLHGDVFNKTEL